MIPCRTHGLGHDPKSCTECAENIFDDYNCLVWKRPHPQIEALGDPRIYAVVYVSDEEGGDPDNAYVGAFTEAGLRRFAILIQKDVGTMSDHEDRLARGIEIIKAERDERQMFSGALPRLERGARLEEADALDAVLVELGHEEATI